MTDVALRDYLERLIGDLDRRIDDRFLAADRAVTKAEVTMSARLNAMNEFREALKDQTNRMATRDELRKLDEVVQVLQQAKANTEGRLFILAGVFSAVVSLVTWSVLRFFGGS